MISARLARSAAVPATILASSLLLVVAAGPIAPLASAQSAEEEKLRAAFLGLRQEFPETLVKITPQLLSLQKQLVEQLRIQLAAVKEDEKAGKLGLAELAEAQLPYLRELETLRVMEARSSNPSISEKEVLKMRIEIRSEALSYLKKLSQQAEASSKVGDMTFADVAVAKATALRAEIALEALKAAAQ